MYLIGSDQPQGQSPILTAEQQKAKLADALMAAGAAQAKTAATPMQALGSLAQTAVGAWQKRPQTTLGPWQTATEGPGGWQTSVQSDGGFLKFLGL